MTALRAGVSIALAALVVATGPSCASTETQPLRVAISDGWLAMGTFFEVDLRVPPGQADRARAWTGEAREEISRLERIYSRHDPKSELSYWNRRWAGAQVAEAPTMGPELAEILQHAARLRVATDGAFDVGIGAVVHLWADAEGTGLRPNEALLDDALRRPSEAGDPMRRVDLDGMSKGQVLDALRAHFADAFPHGAALLSFGQSSIMAIGAPDEGGWRLLLRSSDATRATLGEVRLRDQALSMSSSRGHVYEVEDESVSHVIDPSTGQPVEGVIESVVIADSAMIADAWSTALVVLKQIPKLDVSDSYQDIEATFMDAAGQSFRTPGWRDAAR